MQRISKNGRVTIKERRESMPFAEHKSTDMIAKIHGFQIPDIFDIYSNQFGQLSYHTYECYLTYNH